MSGRRRKRIYTVMAGRGPAIHVFLADANGTLPSA
jgi:hypothetical protein